MNIDTILYQNIVYDTLIYQLYLMHASDNSLFKGVLRTLSVNQPYSCVLQAW